MTVEGPLHMIRMWLESRRLFELSKALRLPQRDVDEGYLVHCLLGELFGAQAPAPFTIDGRTGRHLRLLAYSELSGDALRAAAGLAEPSWHAAMDWERWASKPMPETFPVGMRMGFSLRACPVVRMASDGPRWRKGSEVDAFLARCWKVSDDTPVERQTVYAEWLAGHLERQGGARLTAPPTMEHFQLSRMVRRKGSKQRKAKTIKRPDVTLRGHIEVTDSEVFQALLRRGVGRHRAFGFGMLCVRRA